MEPEERERVERLERELAAMASRLAWLEHYLWATSLGGAPPEAEPTVPAHAPPSTPQPPTPQPSTPQPPTPQPATPQQTPPQPAPPQPSPAPTQPTPGQHPPAQPGPAPLAPTPPPAPPRPRRTVSLEDLLGTRVLALLGGAAVLLGVAFFVAVAIGRGWIDEATRIALAFAASSAMLALGAWLYERKGRTQAALALVGTGVAALYLTLTAGAQLYDLFPTPVALAVAFAVGAVAAGLAVRWQASAIAGLGIVGAILAPVLVGAPTSGGTTAFVIVAFGCASAVLLAERWDWLALAAFVAASPQVLAWSLDDAAPVGLMVGVGAFWALSGAGAIGFELREASGRVRPAAGLLVAAAVVVAAAAGHLGLREIGETGLADAWLAGLALAHLGLAAVALRAGRVSRELGLLLAAQGVATGDLAFGLAASGPALPIGWALGALALTQLPRLVPGGRLRPRELVTLELGLGAQVLMAILHLLLFEAPPRELGAALHEPAGATAAIGAVLVSAALCGRFAGEHAYARIAFDVCAMAALAYLSAAVLGGVALSAAYAAEAVALGEVARRHRDRLAEAGAAAFLALAAGHALAFDAPLDSTVRGAEDLPAALGGLAAVATAALACGRRVFTLELRGALDAVGVMALAYMAAVALESAPLVLAWAGLACLLAELGRQLRDELAVVAAGVLLTLAAGHALVFEAPPTALIDGAPNLLGAALALAAVAAASFFVGRRAQFVSEPAGALLEAVFATALVYLGSVAIISAFQPEVSGLGARILDLSERQQGQLALSAFWALTGLCVLAAGLVRNARRLRLGGLALLGLAIAKVFAYDLSTLESIYRVLSFVGVGLLLLLAAFVYQRLRPRGPERDLREVRAP